MFVIAILSALTLGVLDQIFKSYFNMMMEEEEQEKVLGVPPVQLNQLRSLEQQRLTAASLPIDRAMKELATRGREDPALKDLAKTDITPQPSNDQGPLVGWNGLGREAGALPALEHDAGPTMLIDGAIPAMAGDAAAVLHAAADAAAPKPQADGGAH
jgi:hypothetical protein